MTFEIIRSVCFYKNRDDKLFRGREGMKYPMVIVSSLFVIVLTFGDLAKIFDGLLISVQI